MSDSNQRTPSPLHAATAASLLNAPFYFVIKGPRLDGGELAGQYLCSQFGTLDGYDYGCPQWSSRKHAVKFHDAKHARAWHAAVKEAHPDAGSYDGAVIRVWTARGQRLERRRLRAALEGILDVCRDRQAFVMLGPRSFAKAEQIALEALDKVQR